MPQGKINSSDNNPRKNKLRMKILKLKRQNNKLRQMVRRLRLRQEKQKRITENQETPMNDIQNMQQLSGKLFSGNFSKLLSAQIDALTKNKRGRRYDSDFKHNLHYLYFFQARVIIESC